MRQTIHAFKFQGRSRLAGPLAKLLNHCLVDSSDRVDCIVPVPLHPRRKRQRGYDQTMLLARELSKTTDLPIVPCVERIRNSLPQLGLGHAERQRNVRGAFQLTCPEKIARKRLLLLDDVMTTGATAEEVSRVIRTTSNARDIEVATIARVSRLLA